MHVKDVMAMLMEVMEVVIGLNRSACDKLDCDGDGQCYRIETVMHVIDVMTMVLDIVIGLKL